MAMLICGCGLRLQECLRLRIQGIDLERGGFMFPSHRFKRRANLCGERGVTKQASVHTLKYSFGAHPLGKWIRHQVYSGIAGAPKSLNDYNPHPYCQENILRIKIPLDVMSWQRQSLFLHYRVFIKEVPQF